MPKQRVGTAYVSIRAKMDKLDKDLQDAKSMTMRSANTIQKSVSNIFKGAIAYASVSAVTSFAKSIFETGKEVARLQTAYKEITGSTAAANAEFKFLRDTSDQLGQNFYDLADAYKGIAAASRGTALEGKATRDIFIAVTKASASLGLTSENTKGALVAIQQMMSKGKVSAEELRQQLGERLPGAFNLMAEAIGVSTAELDDMLKEGKVLAQEALPKLANVLENKYSGAVDNATAASNKFNEAIMDFKKELSSGSFMNDATEALKTFTTTLKSPGLQEGLKTIIGLVADAAQAFANLAQSMGGWSAVRNGDLGFFEFATMNSKELSKWMKENYSDAGKLQLKVKQLKDDLAKEMAFVTITPEGHAAKAARTAAIKKQIDEIQKEVEAASRQAVEPLSFAPNAPSLLEPKKLKGNGGSSSTKAKLTDEQKAWKDFYENLDDLRLKSAAQQMEMDDDEIQARKDFAKRLIQLQEEVGADRRLTESEQAKFEQIQKNLQKESTAMVELTEETARAMQDAFSTFFFDAFTGELDDLGDYADAIFKSIAQAAASYMGQMVAFGNTGKGGLFGVDGLLAGLFHSGGRVGYDTPQSRSVNPLLFAGAPRLHGGLMPDEFPAILQRGETVLPKGYGGGAVFNMQIVNNSGAKVSESRTPNGSGGFDIEVLIDQAVADKLGRRGSMSNKVLRNTYGAREGVITR